MWKGLAALTAAAMLAACGGGDDKASGGSPTPGGAAALKCQEKLPEGFTAGFPLPTDNKVVCVQVVEAAGSSSTIAYFKSKEGAPQLTSFFEKQLPSKGWSLLFCQVQPATPEPQTLISATKDDQTATVVIGKMPEGQRPPGLKEDFNFFVFTSKTQTTALPRATGAVTCKAAGQ